MMKSKSALVLAAALGLITVPYSFASDAHHAASSTSAEADAAMSEGEVKKVDKDAGKITIKHGPLVNLEMPAMTMVFRVKAPVMLDQVKAGDKIRFVAEKVNGAITVTRLEPAK
jgi:Cu/Ag efflux protein CusF